LTNVPVYLTNVVAALTTNGDVTVTFDVVGGTNGLIYDVFGTTNLIGNNLTNAQWFWVTNTPTCWTITLTNQTIGQKFYIIGSPQDSDGDSLSDAFEQLVSKSDPNNPDTDADGMPDGWEWNNFGDFDQTAIGDYDSDGRSNLYEYQHSTDPNTIAFSLGFPSQYVNGNSATGALYVLKGLPASVATLVNSTNFDSAPWNAYSSNAVVSLGTNDGDYEVWIGLRGRLATSQQTWIGTTLTRDTVPPRIVVTSPATTISQPFIQLQGYVSESLSRLTYDLSNAAGLFTNQSGFVTGAHPDTNTWKFTTNYFQCYDIPLANGTNRITVASHRFGRQHRYYQPDLHARLFQRHQPAFADPELASQQ